MSPSLQLWSPVQQLSVACSIATTFREALLGLWVGSLLQVGMQLPSGALWALAVLQAHCLLQQPLAAWTPNALS